jgi:hypothetical protein
MNGTAENLIVINAICVWALEWAKGSKTIPFLTKETGNLSQWVSIGLASLASAGMVFAFSHTGNAATGSFTITWQGLSTANVIAFLYHAVGNFATQKGLFKLYKATSTPEVKQ